MIWLIGIGGSLGALSRYLISIIINKKKFPLATWVVNITGSFLLGFVAKLYLTNRIDEGLWLLIGVGFCGAYTTFSTFGNETITLLQSKQTKLAIIYIIATVIISGFAAFLGLTM